MRIVSLSAGSWITAPSVCSESNFCERKRESLISAWKSARFVHKPNHPITPPPLCFFVSSCFVEQLEITYDRLQLAQFGGYPHWPNLLAYWCLPSSSLCSTTLHCCRLQRILLSCVIGCWATEAQSASLRCRVYKNPWKEGLERCLLLFRSIKVLLTPPGACLSILHSDWVLHWGWAYTYLTLRT